jgi:hypothetical protein
MKNKSLIIAGSVLTGVGSSLTLSTGLAYYFKYKQGKLTDSEWFKSYVASNFAVAAAAAIASTSTAGRAASAAAIASTVDNGNVTLAAGAANIAGAAAAGAAAAGAAAAGAIALANTRYKELSLADTIDFYKFWITYASTFIDNLDANNPAFADVISTLKALETASKKERDTIYALVSLFGAVGPAIVIAGVPTLVTGLVRNNKDKKKLIQN